jgi:GT2 family glycosyltransferase
MPVRPPDPLPSVAVIVLNWNGTADTMECLSSVVRADYPRCEIIVVDNGSSPSPADRIRTDFPSVTYVATPQNLGYAGGNNIGIRYALEHEHDYAFVLNNDTVVAPDFLTAAVRVAGSDARIAAVGGKVLLYDDPGTVWVTYGRLTFRKGLVHLIGYLQRDDGRFEQRRDVQWVPGVAMLLRGTAIQQIGLFDETFFAYHEDVDWCTRARRGGWRVVYTPDVRVLHKAHRSSGGSGFVTPRQYLAGRNMVLFVRKHARWYQAVQFLLFQVTTLPLQFLWRWLRGERRGVVLKVRGMLDALRGRPLPLQELGLR